MSKQQGGKNEQQTSMTLTNRQGHPISDNQNIRTCFAGTSVSSILEAVDSLLSTINRQPLLPN